MIQAANALSAAAQSAHLAATTALLGADAATSQTPLFEAAPPVPVPHTARPWLPAVFAGVAAVPTAAMAQPVGVVEHLAAVAPSFPPAWQLIIGAALYAEPALRLVSLMTRGIGKWVHGVLFGESETAPASSTTVETKISVVDRINEVTGAIDAKVSPIRDNIAVRLGLGASILYGATLSDRPMVAYLPEAVALGLSLFNGFDKGGRVQGPLMKAIERDGEITIDAWEREEHRAMGILAPAVRTHFPDDDRIGPNPPPYAEGVIPQKSTWTNVRGLLDTLYFIGLARRLFGQIENRWLGFTGWLRTLFLKKHAEARPRFLRVSNLVVRLWSMRYLRTNRMTVRYTNPEALKVIPKGAPVLAVHVNHDSLFLNFASLMYLIPGLRMVADEANFWGNILLRIFGFSWMMNIIGLLFTSRKSGAGNNEIGQKADALLQGAENGIGVVIFPQAGRSPRMYDDNGKMIPPSVRGNVVGVQKVDGVKRVVKPELYMKNGFARIAVAAADKSGRSIYVPLTLSDDGSGTHGMYYASPKEVKNPPFIGPNLSGQTTHIKTQRVYEVTPGTDVDQLYASVTEEAIRGMDDNARLEKLVAGWAQRLNASHLMQRFADLAHQDERWYTTVARIGEIHPRYSKKGSSVSERQRFIDELFRLLALDAPPSEDFHRLLLETAETVVKTEYMKFK